MFLCDESEREINLNQLENMNCLPRGLKKHADKGFSFDRRIKIFGKRFCNFDIELASVIQENLGQAEGGTVKKIFSVVF